ncbi:hypothetical protein [Vibrio diazotrophicus]|nr:hypothetical protein [Vibrio diazotrophicus]NIY94560.1 hypothetical protein [Vibrio diazotrophicus]
MMTLSDYPLAALTEKLSLPESCATLLTQYISEMRDEKSYPPLAHMP